MSHRDEKSTTGVARAARWLGRGTGKWENADRSRGKLGEREDGRKIPRSIPGNGPSTGGAWNPSWCQVGIQGVFPGVCPHTVQLGTGRSASSGMPGMFQGICQETLALGIRWSGRDRIQGMFQGICPLSKCNCSVTGGVVSAEIIGLNGRLPV